MWLRWLPVFEILMIWIYVVFMRRWRNKPRCHYVKNGAKPKILNKVTVAYSKIRNIAGPYRTVPEIVFSKCLSKMYCPELQIPLNWREALHPYFLIRWVYAVKFAESGAISLLRVYLSSVYLSQSLWGYPFDAGITQHITIITSCRPTFTPILITLKTIHTVIHTADVIFAYESTQMSANHSHDYLYDYVVCNWRVYLPRIAD